MMRTSAPRALLRPLARSPAAIGARTSQNVARFCVNAAARPSATGAKAIKPLALTAFRQPNTALTRGYASGAIPGTYRDAAKEAQYGEKILGASPEVSTISTVNEVVDHSGTKSAEDDVDMMAGIRHDVKVIRDTFALDSVPTEAYRIGLAGVLPYLATSSGTVYCAFELNKAAHNGGIGYLINEQTAEAALHVLEPLQVGYGAVILSFLGAIHWGLEWAGYGGKHGYNRYAFGVLAPAIAWPTILLPVEYALITQFLAFNIFYAADATAANRGWTPPWYGPYRFILTFIVGISIVLSLIGRGQVADRIGTMPSTADRVREMRSEMIADKSKKDVKGESDEE